MRRIAFSIVMMVLAGSTCAYAAAPVKAPDPLPSQDAILKTFESGDYAIALQQLNRVLPLRGKAAAGYDRYELFMLKGETHLRLKQFKTAGDAFGAAAKETKDDIKGATARATQKLVREAKGPDIQRRVPRKDETLQTASLLDPDKRSDAIHILYDDLRADAEPKIKEATRARTLPPIEEALTLLLDLRDFELAANPGGDAAAKHDKAVEDLGKRSQQLIGKELDRMETQVAAIYASANEIAAERVRTRVGIRSSRQSPTDYRNEGATETETVDTVYRGLSRQDRTDLDRAIDTSGKIITTLDALTRIGSGEITAADKLSARAKTVMSDARRVRNTQFRGTPGGR